MNTRRLLWLCVLLIVAPVSGQGAPASLDGTLVRCGAERVAVVEGTVSKDSHFALGWTLRSKANKPPVDWAAYSRKDPAAFVAKFNPEGTVDFPDDGDYQLVNGVLDLTAKTFTTLATDAPFYPGEPHSVLSAAWSEDRHGNRYGVVNNVIGTNHSENTAGLWLVTTDAESAHVHDLQPDADKAVKSFLHKRDPKDAERYQWSFSFENAAADGEAPMNVFKGEVLTLHFIAQVPEEAKNVDAGYVSFTLPGGKVRTITDDKPFRRAATR